MTTKKKPTTTTKKKPTTNRRRASPARPRARKASRPPAAEEPQALAPIAAPDAVVAAVTESAPPESYVPLSSPEPIFAARFAPPETERPFPASRRAIFFDVENTSRAQHISRVIDHLQIDRGGHRTEFLAVGNWRVIGHDTARLLARHGAHLVHSAPSVGVRDWSDLRIAVAAGAWLASARPGDVIEIVSDDRAFDAVGDVAASLGIRFRRLSYRGLAGAPADELPPAVPEQGVAESRAPSSERRGQRYRGRYHGRRDGRAAPSRPASPAPIAVSPPPAAAPIEREPAGGEPHTAPHDEIVAIVRDLMRSAPGRAVSIDTLANALKSRGFSRPPGSPRLITRLRRLKDIDLDRAGMITLVGSAPSVEIVEPPEPAVVTPAAVEPEPEPEDDGPGPGNERIEAGPPASDEASVRRRRRRGGRRRHGRGRPQPSAAP